VYLWRRTAELLWVEAHEDLLQAHAHEQLVIVQKPGRKRPDLEIICRSQSDSSALLKEFGGRIKPLPRNWMQRFTRADSTLIKIGRRLVIARPDALSAAHATAHSVTPRLLVIPASLAFGTGEHATTAMSLRFLEQLTRRWKRGWSFVDLGTGSGILALAAKSFGAGCVIGIDNDPVAISVAKSNARLNKIRAATFQLGDVHK
jgi:ribosomal protein L11 methyltransferase